MVIEKKMHTTGLELLLDLYDCNSDSLSNVDALERVLREAIQPAGFEVVDRIAHQFSSQGVTLVLILAQSHAMLHTWPEARFVTADVYACGLSADISPVLETVRQRLIHLFQPRAHTFRLIERGLDTDR